MLFISIKSKRLLKTRSLRSLDRAAARPVRDLKVVKECWFSCKKVDYVFYQLQRLIQPKMTFGEMILIF